MWTSLQGEAGEVHADFPTRLPASMFVDLNFSNDDAILWTRKIQRKGSKYRVSWPSNTDCSMQSTKEAGAAGECQHDRQGSG
ncbi:hypothetical protein BKA80DRAFT_78357 [Phyllosticta citrichinensis]